MNRVQRKRTKGAKHPNTRYCGRGTHLGNNYKVITIKGKLPLYYVENEKTGYKSYPNSDRKSVHEHAIHMYKGETEMIMKHDRGWIARLKQDLSQYEHLSCFCPLDMPCHVDYLIELVNMPGVFLL